MAGNFALSRADNLDLMLESALLLPVVWALTPSGSVILDPQGQLHFDPARRQEFESKNRYQLRLPGETRDYRRRV